MKIGFAGRWSPLDKTAWSGTYFNAYRSIKNQYETSIYHYAWPWHIRESLILHKQLQRLIHKKAAVEFLKGYAKHFSKQLERELLKRKADLLFVPSAPQLIAYCDTTIPVIYMTDASFYQLQGYYPLFSNLARYNIEQGIAIDRKAFQKSSHCMLASEWAKRSAIKDYGIAENKITVAPLGANLDRIPMASELKKGSNEKCQLLFLGVEWERKGGQLALDIFYLLDKMGFPVQLTIIGCLPPLKLTDKNIRVIPSLNKNDAGEAEQLYNVLLRTDLLLIPTRAECAGVVFCEASAFGIPSITTDTGGVSTYVENGVNGFLFPVSAPATVYAEKIMDLYNDMDAYEQLCKSSRKKYETLLNWDKWGNSFARIATTILNNS